MTDTLSRRTLAKGAAWSVPVVAAAATVPALAVSPTKVVPSGKICRLYFGGGSVNAQTTSVYLSVDDTATGYVPAHSTITWTFTASSATLPSTNYPTNGGWALSRVATANGFTVTLTTGNDPVAVSAINCQARLIWDGSSDVNSARITPKSTLSYTSQQNTPANSLAFTIPRRYGTSVNDNNRTPLIFTSSDDKCYPEVQWSNIGNASTSHKDNLTDYPDKKSVAPTSNAGNNQEITVARCA